MLVIRGTKLFGADSILLWQAARKLKWDRNGFVAVAEAGRPEGLTASDFAHAIGMPMSECLPVLEAMKEAGWLSAGGNPNEYSLEQPLYQFAAARVGRPLKRSKADELLAKIVAEAKAINREVPSDLPLVTRVVVFGSYLDAKKTELGDLDLAVDTVRRPAPMRGPAIPKEDRYREILRSMRRRDPVKKRLGGGSPYVSLHDVEELEGGKYEARVIYELESDLPEVFSQVAGQG